MIHAIEMELPEISIANSMHAIEILNLRAALLMQLGDECSYVIACMAKAVDRQVRLPLP